MEQPLSGSRTGQSPTSGVDTFQAAGEAICPYGGQGGVLSLRGTVSLLEAFCPYEGQYLSRFLLRGKCVVLALSKDDAEYCIGIL